LKKQHWDFKSYGTSYPVSKFRCPAKNKLESNSDSAVYLKLANSIGSAHHFSPQNFWSHSLRNVHHMSVLLTVNFRVHFLGTSWKHFFFKCNSTQAFSINSYRFEVLIRSLVVRLLGGSSWMWVLPFCSLYSPFFGCFGLFMIGRVSALISQ
jgi:hypothetical protein